MRFLARTSLAMFLGAWMAMGCGGSGRGMRAARDAREVRAPRAPGAELDGDSAPDAHTPVRADAGSLDDWLRRRSGGPKVRADSHTISSGDGASPKR